MDPTLPAYIGMAAIVFTAYTVFGLTGFGSSIVAVPVLVQFVPLSFAVPLVLLLDLAATSAVGVSNWKQISRAELLRLMPCMLIGVAIGVIALVGVQPRWLLLALGVFVLANATWSLVAPPARHPIGTLWVVPAGVVGGVFSALFGTGGPIYTIYLARRLDDAGALRATMTAVVLTSALMRLVVFTGVGLLQQDNLLLTGLWLLPVCAAGVFAGSRLRGALPPARIKQALFVVLMLGGAGAIVRALSM
ncbi:sulfite exporter TauE/SafE family protein [Methylibium sp.]|uniref:sulfite exporter TauE/SafE family protein n=1 Tax=Methylibium sp. TaxID=2067992 RepID=UPI0017EC280D|nr:sulfite exporter TauE/SafE family protein [Methylibium sp.]MBA3588149.1 sulfite exporter TauE/SafE family protein [Methylibium sp.]